MEYLSAALKETISKNPTNTVLRGDSYNVNNDYKKIKKEIPTGGLSIPDVFDGRDYWKGLLSPVLNQGQCGSCWAFASVGSLSSRFNIQSRGLINIQLSPVKLILCDVNNKNLDSSSPYEALLNIKKLPDDSCYGNSLFNAYEFLYLIGTCTMKCLPYTQKLLEYTETQSLPLCSNIAGEFGDMCSDYSVINGIEYGTPARFYRAYHFYTMAGTPEDGGSEFYIRYDIFKWGPISTGMQIYPDFYTFDAKNEIYEWNGLGPQVGGHAVELVGWGIENGKLYWQVKNSWGTDWGDKGYFKMIRGKNNCGIESNAIGAIPDFFYPIGQHVNIFGSFQESQKIANKRTAVFSPIVIDGTDIDPLTGYSRRVLATMPTLDLEPPVYIKDLPDWQTFIAGKDLELVTDSLHQKDIKNTTYNDLKIVVIIFLTLSTLFIFYLFILKIHRGNKMVEDLK